uniref:Uncharacterized protein n=1 Tax=Candidatus Kentrum sp. MB TaxID=2138164 RepID=A0A451BGC5_9GAMM|nr:MAG: hypothetical protein BECKMB1821I_GA0114274_10284 [Candidatus Kentron sp. MB]VFK77322.1 MAG: hypothetical protein BECKMB1821H_GA0114242_11234 [Candidatus Kentron sp. MB]
MFPLDKEMFIFLKKMYSLDKNIEGMHLLSNLCIFSLREYNFSTSGCLPAGIYLNNQSYDPYAQCFGSLMSMQRMR